MTDGKRYTAARNATIARDVINGRMTVAEICAAHSLSVEELEGWITGVNNRQRLYVTKRAFI